MITFDDAVLDEALTELIKEGKVYTYLLNGEEYLAKTSSEMPQEAKLLRGEPNGGR